MFCFAESKKPQASQWSNGRWEVPVFLTEKIFFQVLQYKRKNAEQEAVIDERANDVARLQSEVWLDFSLWYKQLTYLIFCRFS